MFEIILKNDTKHRLFTTIELDLQRCMDILAIRIKSGLRTLFVGEPVEKTDLIFCVYDELIALMLFYEKLCFPFF